MAVTKPAKHPNFPYPFPTLWASAWGEDTFGLWVKLALPDSDVSQVFRWIEPGRFLMGSPESEPEREPWDKGNERQHEVSLSGYWLADTACDQTFWETVMSDNPASFKENSDNPVESVSWNDTQTFITELNRLVPGLQACLPTEAQWEYACRAGTTTPFSFGENITPEQVNYDGEFPYADGKKGLNRGNTVPVKSLPPNPWGIYQMHGNVWEWCQDWYGEYPTELAANPSGPNEGVDRVLRGGSWFALAGRTRSAGRNRYEPDYRYFNIGFRLALGQPEHAGNSARTGQASASAAGQARGRGDLKSESG